MRDSEHDANLYMSGPACKHDWREMQTGTDPYRDNECRWCGIAWAERYETTSGSVDGHAAGRALGADRVQESASVISDNSEPVSNPVPLTPDWNAPNGHLIPEYMRGAGAVIDWARTERWQMTQRAERRREYGAKAVGMLTALLRLGELRECYREQAREIISEWEQR